MPAKEVSGVVQAVLVTGGMLGEVVDRVQVFAQVGDEGQRVREGPEVVDPLQVARRDQGREAIGRGVKAVCQLQEQPFEELNQAAEQRADGKNTQRFRVDFFTGQQRFHRVEGIWHRPVQVVFQHLHFQLNGALHHRGHHPLHFILQFGALLGIGRSGQAETDALATRRYLSQQDGFIHIGQLGLYLTGQVLRDWKRGDNL